MVPRQRQAPSPPATMEDTSSNNSSGNLQEPFLRKNGKDADNKSSKQAEQEAAAELSRWRHDLFNIYALIPVIITCCMNWNLRDLCTGTPPGDAWHGNYFMLNWSVTMAYFAVDLLWVAMIPKCVKSPSLILKHHLVTMLYLIGPLFWVDFRWFMGACLSVEINTWFLITRRVLYKIPSIPSLVMDSVSFCFYTSWIVIRVGIYPYIMYEFLRMTYWAIVETGQFHSPMLSLPVHFFLCVLNLKWTYELFAPIIRRWYRKEKATDVATGL